MTTTRIACGWWHGWHPQIPHNHYFTTDYILCYIYTRSSSRSRERAPPAQEAVYGIYIYISTQGICVCVSDLVCLACGLQCCCCCVAAAAFCCKQASTRVTRRGSAKEGRNIREQEMQTRCSVLSCICTSSVPVEPDA